MTPDEKVETKEEPKRYKGKIIHVSEEGWGFITTPEIKFTRIFFHWTGLRNDTLNFKDLMKGMQVEFSTKEYEDKGLRAIKIEVLK
jgi:cold shock CspA family protein